MKFDKDGNLIPAQHPNWKYAPVGVVHPAEILSEVPDYTPEEMREITAHMEEARKRHSIITSALRAENDGFGKVGDIIELPMNMKKLFDVAKMEGQIQIEIVGSSDSPSAYGHYSDPELLNL